MTRFSRTRQLLGEDGLAKLRSAHVAVVGLGAVGSYAVEGLARSGVGHLRLVDFDEIRASNINRQLYALDSTLGQRKVDAAAARVRDINPDCRVEPMGVFVSAETAASVLAPPLDVVIDAIDSVGPKAALIEAAVRAGLKVISAMGAALRRNPAAVRVGDIEETRDCPLARHVRRRLHLRGIRSGVVCVYSREPVPKTAVGEPGADSDGPAFLRRGRPRRPLGSLSCLPGMFGLAAAATAINWLCGAPPASSVER